MAKTSSGRTDDARTTGRRVNHAPTPKSVRTRTRILDAAASVFAEHGYADSSLRDIAEVAGIKAGSFYYHFDSKEELVQEVMRSGIVQIHEHVEEAVSALGDDARPQDRLRVAIRAHVESVLERTDYARALMRTSNQVPNSVRENHYRQSRTYGEYWGRLLEDARRAGEIRSDVDLMLTRMLVIGALNWTVEWPASLWSPEAIADTLFKLMFGPTGDGQP